jgi:hypothetical protein
MPELSRPLCISLLHCEGADEAKVFTDETGRIWTPSGNTKIDNGQAKFGSTSLYQAADGYVTCADNADLDFGTGDFTLASWINVAGVPSVGRILAAGLDADGDHNQWFWGFGTVWGGGTKLNWAYRDGGGYVESNSSALTYTLDTQSLAAVVRYGNTITQYFDGVPVSTQDVTGISINAGSTGLIIAARYTTVPAEGWSGYLDEILVYKEALWTADFSASLPTEAFTLTAVPACYLNARRDRMNTRGLSTQNQLV